MDSELTRWVILAIINIPLYLILGRLFFDDLAGFFECVGFWLTPDWISVLRGEWADDWWGTMKLFVFAALCAGAVFGEHQLFFGHARTQEPAAVSTAAVSTERP